MPRPTTASRPMVRAAAALALTLLPLATGADGPLAGLTTHPTVRLVLGQAEISGRRALAWYDRTPPMDRITWGGLAACAILGLGVFLERTVRLRRRRILPPAFVDRFMARLQEGKLDRLKGQDLCELNPSPAARVTAAAIQRWGRSTADLERAVALISRVENDRLWGSVGTLRRIAVLAPLLGLLGTLGAAARALAAQGPAPAAIAWGPALAAALAPLTAGVALAILAMAAYDGLVVRVETLSRALDRLGAATIDAIAMAPPAPESRPNDRRARPHTHPVPPVVPSPHRVRAERIDPIAMD
jgi:biopolymer transport protein ExbB